jgi:hypothetical protein
MIKLSRDYVNNCICFLHENNIIAKNIDKDILGQYLATKMIFCHYFKLNIFIKNTFIN